MNSNTRPNAQTCCQSGDVVAWLENGERQPSNWPLSAMCQRHTLVLAYARKRDCDTESVFARIPMVAVEWFCETRSDDALWLAQSMGEDATRVVDEIQRACMDSSFAAGSLIEVGPCPKVSLIDTQDVTEAVTGAAMSHRGALRRHLKQADAMSLHTAEAPPCPGMGRMIRALAAQSARYPKILVPQLEIDHGQ